MKTVKILLALVLAMGMVMCLIACGGEETKTTEAATTQATEQPTEATQEETQPTEAANPTYTVTVVDEGGNPVVGAMVQLCDEACYPGVTDDNGVATFSLVEANYKVSFLKVPEGYEQGEETEFYFDEGAFEMTVILKAVA